MTTSFLDMDGVRHGDRTVVLKPVVKHETTDRDAEAGLNEAVGLAKAIDLVVVSSALLHVSKPNPATLLGKGQVELWAAFVAEQSVTLVVVDHALVPVQQRNLEKELKCKVIDRTGLILEIFGERARSKEGQLQVELAALDYQKTRLVRSWTHLERQRGGFGFLGGPGESQLEMDRRLINGRIAKLKGELKDVKRNRSLQREARKRAEHPTVALIGYTNAGKSSLFNRLTGAGVLAKDMLFATLDQTMRGIKLPSGREAILSDTVGFISQLPTHLIEAFRATLEEVQFADLILHVRDVAHGESRAQKEAVLEVLLGLGIEQNDDRLVEVLNKIDLLNAEDQTHMKDFAHRSTWDAEHMPKSLEGVTTEAHAGTVAVSAMTGGGIDDLLALIDRRLDAHRQLYDIDLSLSDGAALAWLYAHGKIVDRKDGQKMMRLQAMLDETDYARFRKKFHNEELRQEE